MKSPHGNAPIHLAFLMALFLVAWAVTSVDHVDAQDASPDQTIKAEWQVITYSGKATVRRTRVPSGWLVIIESENTSDSDPMLVLDKKHSWLNIEAERTTFASYVAADRATYEALAPELQKYLKYVSKNPARSRTEKVLESWKARIEAAEREQH